MQDDGAMPDGGVSHRTAAIHTCLAGVALASAAGLSVYIAFCFGIFLAAWILRLAFRGELRATVPFLLASVTALLLSIPLLLDLRAPAGRQLDFRTHKTAHLITTGLRTSGWIKAHVPPSNHWRGPLLLLDLSATYILEFGFYFVVFVLVAPHLWRRRRRLPEAQIALCCIFATALFVTTFLRSEAIRSNDLGMRSPLLVEWVLLLWAIPLLHGFSLRRTTSTHRRTLWLLRATLFLGVAASIYQLVLLRFAEPLQQWASTRTTHLPIAALPVPDNGRDTYEIRAAETTLRPLTRRDTVAAFNPYNPDQLLLLFDTPMQIAAATPHDCGTPFGGSIANCAHTEKILNSIFADRVAPVPAASLDAACKAASVNLLLVQSSDPVWHIRGSWVWRRPALVADPVIRAVSCGDGS